MADAKGAQNGERETVQSSSSDLQIPPRYSALYEAAEKGDVQEISRLLLHKMVDVNGRSGEHGALRTALHGAAGYGHWKATKALLTVSLTFLGLFDFVGKSYQYFFVYLLLQWVFSIQEKV